MAIATGDNTMFYYYRSQFIDSVRKVMQAPEWFVFIDEQETLEIKFGRSVQFTLDFRGE